MKRMTLAIASALCLARIGAAWSAEGARRPVTSPPAKSSQQPVAPPAMAPAGSAQQAGIPHIAGQHASYIQGALIAYQKGARKDDRMHQAVAQLSEKDIANVAAYYAGLEASAHDLRRREPRPRWRRIRTRSRLSKS